LSRYAGFNRLEACISGQKLRSRRLPKVALSIPEAAGAHGVQDSVKDDDGELVSQRN
jgi:hypothetical protein